MKQETKYKLLAVLLAFTMLGSIFLIMFNFNGQNENSNSDTASTDTNLEKYNPEFWNSVNEPFNSISDGLRMTPPGAVMANYVDLESMPIQMIQWVSQEIPIIQEVDSLYKSNTTKMYYASIKEGNNDSFLLLSTMSIPKNDFEYIVLPNTNYILQRQDTGAINIMGTPVIYAPDKTASEVLEIIWNSSNISATAYDDYKNVLSKVEPAPYQILNANVSFAKQFYIGLNFVNGSYERTTAYLDANSSVLKKINQSKANSTQKGYQQFSINQSGNYTIVKIVSPELFKVLSEETN
jgi:hypothetical protein